MTCYGIYPPWLILLIPGRGDRLPRLKDHLPRLAALHYRALRIFCMFRKRARLRPYAECFNIERADIPKLSEAEFTAKYWQIMEPQERIAHFQGFGILA